MPVSEPEFAEVLRAITAYLPAAYPESPPARVGKLLATLESSSSVLKCPVFVAERGAHSTRYTLRLGNQFYPHMKLVVEPAPDGSRFLYRADTHDRHVCPPVTSPEHAVFCQLMEKNQRLAEAIDIAWEQAGIATFKSYLREDLRRRKAALKAAGRSDRPII